MSFSAGYLNVTGDAFFDTSGSNTANFQTINATVNGTINVNNATLNSANVTGNITVGGDLSVTNEILGGSLTVMSNVVLGGSVIPIALPQTVTPGNLSNPLSGKTFYYYELFGYYGYGYNRITITDNALKNSIKVSQSRGNPISQWIDTENTSRLFPIFTNYQIKYLSSCPYNASNGYTYGTFGNTQPCISISYGDATFFFMHIIALNESGTDFYQDSNGRMNMLEIVLATPIWDYSYKSLWNAIPNGGALSYSLFNKMTTINFTLGSTPLAILNFTGNIDKSKYAITNTDFVTQLDSTGNPTLTQYVPLLLNYVLPGPTTTEQLNTQFNYPNDLIQWVAGNSSKPIYGEGGDTLANGNIVYCCIDALNSGFPLQNNTSYKQIDTTLKEYHVDTGVVTVFGEYPSATINGTNNCTDGFFYTNVDGGIRQLTQSGVITKVTPLFSYDLSGNPWYFMSNDIKATEYPDSSGVLHTYVFFSGVDVENYTKNLLLTQRQNPKYLKTTGKTYIGMWNVSTNTVYRVGEINKGGGNGIDVSSDNSTIVFCRSNGPVQSYHVSWTTLASLGKPTITLNNGIFPINPVTNAASGNRNSLIPFPNSQPASPIFNSTYMTTNGKIMICNGGEYKYTNIHANFDGSYNKFTNVAYIYDDTYSNSCAIDNSGNFYYVRIDGLFSLQAKFEPIQTFDGQTPSDTHFYEMSINQLLNGGVQMVLSSYDSNGFQQQDCISNVSSSAWTDTSSSGGSDLFFNALDFLGNFVPVVPKLNLHGLASGFVGVNVSNATFAVVNSLYGIAMGTSITFKLKMIDASGNKSLSSESVTIKTACPIFAS